MPSGTDYALTAAVTIAKNRIHIIGAGGITNSSMPPSFTGITQATAGADIFHVTASNAACVEIAGFWFTCGTDGRALIWVA